MLLMPLKIAALQLRALCFYFVIFSRLQSPPLETAESKADRGWNVLCITAEVYNMAKVSHF